MNSLFWAAERTVFRQSLRGSLSVAWTSVRRTETLIAYRTSSMQSVVRASAWSVEDITVANVDEWFQVAYLRTFRCWIGLVQAYSTVASMIHECGIRYVCRPDTNRSQMASRCCSVNAALLTQVSRLSKLDVDSKLMILRPFRLSTVFPSGLEYPGSCVALPVFWLMTDSTGHACF